MCFESLRYHLSHCFIKHYCLLSCILIIYNLLFIQKLILLKLLKSLHSTKYYITLNFTTLMLWENHQPNQEVNISIPATVKAIQVAGKVSVGGRRRNKKQYRRHLLRILISCYRSKKVCFTFFLPVQTIQYSTCFTTQVFISVCYLN